MGSENVATPLTLDDEMRFAEEAIIRLVARKLGLPPEQNRIRLLHEIGDVAPDTHDALVHLLISYRQWSRSRHEEVTAMNASERERLLGEKRRRLAQHLRAVHADEPT